MVELYSMVIFCDYRVVMYIAEGVVFAFSVHVL